MKSTDSDMNKAENHNGKPKMIIALAGRANVGKSVIFNHYTGIHQHVGNWPGKTVEKAEGTMYFKGRTIDVLDLPGIYSLSTYSLEEDVSREYIAVHKPDLIINVVDATRLERNLVLTFQLMELGRPMVIALNMMNLLKERGMEIDCKKLEKTLGIPVIPVDAIHGKGLKKLIECGIETADNNLKPKPPKYGKEVEKRIAELESSIRADLSYSKRWLSIRALEEDVKIEHMLKEADPKILAKAKILGKELEKIHGHDASIVISAERCQSAYDVTKEVLKTTSSKNPSIAEMMDSVTSDRIWGYPIMFASLLLLFGIVFTFGNWISSMLDFTFSWVETWWVAALGSSILSLLALAAVKSLLALAEIAIPYILPFYFLLYFLEDLGYLARISFLMDRFMHKLGVHGKACIPMILGFGCNVPACLACRIMETHRERFITGLLVIFIPCSALTVVILGLVGKYVGIGWAIGLYVLDIAVIAIVGRIASKILPGEPAELIMEMPEYRMPNMNTIILQTWFRLSEFIFMASPLIVISGMAIEFISLIGWMPAIAGMLSPITVLWLGLPAVTGILLLFGILRKELILVMLIALLGLANLAQAMTPVQMITLTIVSMFYMPCISTMAAFMKEFGAKRTIAVTVFKIIFALLLAGVAARILPFFL